MHETGGLSATLAVNRLRRCRATRPWGSRNMRGNAEQPRRQPTLTGRGRATVGNTNTATVSKATTPALGYCGRKQYDTPPCPPAPPLLVGGQGYQGIHLLSLKYEYSLFLHNTLCLLPGQLTNLLYVKTETNFFSHIAVAYL